MPRHHCGGKTFHRERGHAHVHACAGECPGTYGLECAMDELAAELRMDPLKLRLANHSRSHPIHDKPWSTNHLEEAYRVGAEKFGWAQRSHEPRSMRKDGLLVGWGVAT